ncbi:DUF928 domain-containing protein [Flavihumibacter rivuli]|uniref:DUF928 domain-containing protein n=1 Tax=Flavihumibacter rivuli TaxID=2838156 RepID=UPI001BDF3315|nr:DUF928 domain-containing protein [Flavihumibacter rivuli]ULQ55434.1 DUF928 domain-containing protein [Flavihumibacter rivuli]
MRIILTIGCLLMSGLLMAQVSFQFLPEIHGRNVDGLLAVKMTNFYGERKTAVLQVVVNEEKTGKVLNITTQPFELMPGLSGLPIDAMRSAMIQFGNSPLAAMVRQSGVFGSGEYEFCFSLKDGTKGGSEELLGEQCFDQFIEPLSPLLLVEPYDAAQLCDKRPMLQWQPSLPLVPGTQYKLTLVEVLPGQTPVEAIRMNIPLINQPGIVNPILFFPPNARDLVEGKNYAWQVDAYKNGFVINRSEIWQFKLECPKEEPPVPADGYRSIEDLAKGNFYLATGKILFSMNNPYAPFLLKYSIESLTEPEQEINKLPKIMVGKGDNKIQIDLEEHPSFKSGHQYILTVELPGGTLKKLRFTYNEK